MLLLQIVTFVVTINDFVAFKIAVTNNRNETITGKMDNRLRAASFFYHRSKVTLFLKVICPPLEESVLCGPWNFKFKSSPNQVKYLDYPVSLWFSSHFICNYFLLNVLIQKSVWQKFGWWHCEKLSNFKSAVGP